MTPKRNEEIINTVSFILLRDGITKNNLNNERYHCVCFNSSVSNILGCWLHLLKRKQSLRSINLYVLVHSHEYHILHVCHNHQLPMEYHSIFRIVQTLHEEHHFPRSRIGILNNTILHPSQFIPCPWMYRSHFHFHHQLFDQWY